MTQLTRREVLATTAAAVVASQTARAEEKPKRPWKKAVMAVMIKSGGTVLEKFQMLKDAGLDGIELHAPGQFKIDEVKEACKRTGLQVEGVCGAFHWHVSISDNDPKVRATALEHMKGALREAQQFGATSMLHIPAVVSNRVTYDDAYKRAQEEIRKAIPVAAETGVKIAIENVWNQFLLSPLEAARFVDEFESPHVGWHFDIGNIIAFGWAEQWIRILGKRIVKLHFKEYSRKIRDEKGMRKGFDVDLLQGDNDWPAIMKALDEIGYNTWACAEVQGGGAERMKTIAGQLDKILAI